MSQLIAFNELPQQACDKSVTPNSGTSASQSRSDVACLHKQDVAWERSSRVLAAVAAWMWN